MIKLTKEDLEKYKKSHYLTVGDIKKWMEKNSDIPDDSIVLVQRVEDRYYKDWGVYLKEGETAWNQRNLNQDMQDEIDYREKGLDLENSQYPDLKNPEKSIVEINDDLMEQYHPAWSCVRYSDEKNIMFIDMFY